MRTSLAFLGQPCRWHEEQCSLAEFSAYLGRDVIAHIDLAAEARVKVPVTAQHDAESEVESDDDSPVRRSRNTAELVDMGGGDDGIDADMDDVQAGEYSLHPLRDVASALALCFQQPHLVSLSCQKRKSQNDLNLKAVDQTYQTVLKQHFGLEAVATDCEQHGYGKESVTMLALQKTNSLDSKETTDIWIGAKRGAAAGSHPS